MEGTLGMQGTGTDQKRQKGRAERGAGGRHGTEWGAGVRQAE